MSDRCLIGVDPNVFAVFVPVTHLNNTFSFFCTENISNHGDVYNEASSNVFKYLIVCSTDQTSIRDSKERRNGKH